jgi:hypothetical protein
VLEPFPEIGFGKSLSFFNGFFFSLPSKNFYLSFKCSQVIEYLDPVYFSNTVKHWKRVAIHVKSLLFLSPKDWIF